MDFGTLPPEVNSARIYTGPGAESMLVAASAWEELAAQLRSTAISFATVIAALATDWLGPSSAAMTTATQPQITWLHTVAAQAEHSAAQARTAAAAFENALAATVPPPVIEANRTTMAALTATNIIGQNSTAIAATEAQYAAMWAQDAAAMHGYAAASAAAAHLTPFSDPQSADYTSGAASAQPAALTQAAAASTGTNARSLMAQITAALNNLAAPAADGLTREQMSELSLFIRDVLNPFGSLSPIEKGAELFEFPATASLPARNGLVSSTLGFALATRGFNTGELPVPLIPGIPNSPLAGTASATTPVSATIGRAGSTGALSVPPSWTTATPTIRLAAAALRDAGSISALSTAAPSVAGPLSQIALASAAGSILGSTATRAAAAATGNNENTTCDPEPGNHPRSPNIEHSNSDDKLQRVLADLSQDPAAVQHWHTDKAHLDTLLEELSTQPGIHAVHVAKRNKPRPTSTRAPRWN